MPHAASFVDLASCKTDSEKCNRHIGRHFPAGLAGLIIFRRSIVSARPRTNDYDVKSFYNSKSSSFCLTALMNRAANAPSMIR
jgi:hypothetical protein